MNTSRIWTLGAVVAVIAIIVGAVGLGMQPQLAAAAAAKTTTTETQTQVSGTQAELTRLSLAAAKQSDLQADADDLRWAIPRTLQLSTFATQLQNLAALDDVKITALSPAAATAYVSPIVAASPAPSTTGASGSSTPTPTPTPTASTASASTTTTAGTAADPGWFGKTDPLITGTNFLVIPVTIIVTGEEAAGLSFAEDAQQMRRLFVVDTVTYAGAEGDVPTTTISGEMYALKR